MNHIPGGATEDPGGRFDLGAWTAKYKSEKSGTAMLAVIGTLAQSNQLLLGPKRYDILSGTWPQNSADNPIGPVFNKANKYWMTPGAGNLAWAISHPSRDIDDLKKVKLGDGPEMVLWGSSTLYPRQLEANLN